nr:hypothetical protein CFP56_24027 [Quercus suber]
MQLAVSEEGGRASGVILCPSLLASSSQLHPSLFCLAGAGGRELRCACDQLRAAAWVRKSLGQTSEQRHAVVPVPCEGSPGRLMLFERLIIEHRSLYCTRLNVSDLCTCAVSRHLSLPCLPMIISRASDPTIDRRPTPDPLEPALPHQEHDPTCLARSLWCAYQRDHGSALCAQLTMLPPDQASAYLSAHHRIPPLPWTTQTAAVTLRRMTVLHRRSPNARTSLSSSSFAARTVTSTSPPGLGSVFFFQACQLPRPGPCSWVTARERYPPTRPVFPLLGEASRARARSSRR